MSQIIHGRISEIQEDQITILNETGSHPVQIDLKHSDPFKPGDIVSVQNQKLCVLTTSQIPFEEHMWSHQILSPRRIRGVQMRQKVEHEIRSFFRSRGFLETRTPALVSCPGMETHIRPFEVWTTRNTKNKNPELYLPTSPEFAMKKLLTGGLEKIFQICPSFRDEPSSPQHRPEFTLLEWYRAYADEETIQSDTETLIEHLAIEILGNPELNFRGNKISVKTPWPRFSVRELFQKFVSLDLAKATVSDLKLATNKHQCPTSSENWDDLFFILWLNVVEPKLPQDQAFFITRYPQSQAALARLVTEKDGTTWAKRFEAYLGHLELANAFEELTDPDEQLSRFEKDMNERVQLYENFPKSPIDDAFIRALREGMPPSSGIALGVDRLVMCLANETDIDYTFWI